MKRLKKFIFAIAGLMVCLNGIAVPTQKDLTQDEGPRAEKFIQELGDKGIKTLTGKGLTKIERQKKFEEFFIGSFDYNRIGKFVLGRFRREVMSADMKQYLGLFKKMVVRVYAARFGEYNDEKFKASGFRIVDKKVDTVIVSSKIIRPNDSKIAIEWQMYQDKSGDFKIFDVVVEGVSMALTQRSEFASILQKDGIKGLITELQTQKNKSAK